MRLWAVTYLSLSARSGRNGGTRLCNTAVYLLRRLHSGPLRPGRAGNRSKLRHRQRLAAQVGSDSCGVQGFERLLPGPAERWIVGEGIRECLAALTEGGAHDGEECILVGHRDGWGGMGCQANRIALATLGFRDKHSRRDLSRLFRLRSGTGSPTSNSMSIKPLQDVGR